MIRGARGGGGYRYQLVNTSKKTKVGALLFRPFTLSQHVTATLLAPAPCKNRKDKDKERATPVSSRGKFGPTGLYPASPRVASPTHPHSSSGCLELLQAPASFLWPRHRICLASSTCVPVPNARTIGRDVSSRSRGRWRTPLHC